MAKLKESRNVCTLVILLYVAMVTEVGSIKDPSQGSVNPRSKCGGDAVDWSRDRLRKWPTVLLAILARDAEHYLHNYLGYIENMDYPKDRISVWVATDSNSDNTSGLLQEWAGNIQSLYHNVVFEDNVDPDYVKDGKFDEWTDNRYIHIAKLRQRALDVARQQWADYILFVDVDNFLVNNQTLKVLVNEKKPIIGPMLTTANTKETYSNFWCGTDKSGYYRRTDKYLPIRNWQTNGTFEAAMIHSVLLIDLRVAGSEKLTYYPPHEQFKGEIDDIVILADSAIHAGLPMFVTNSDVFGYMLSPKDVLTLEESRNDFVNFKIKTLVNHCPIPVSKYISPPTYLDPLEDFGLEQIYMINLERVPMRRNRMFAALNELRINFTYFPAVDGRRLNDSYLEELGMQRLPDWLDPWGERPMTMGEIGCFLSHYFIWQEMAEEGWERIFILEDDIDFVFDFKQNLKKVINTMKEKDIYWDLIYVGRKILHGELEQVHEEVDFIVSPDYSYWTLGYLLSRSGVEKLLLAEPLKKILPVDEFLPIMFDKHPNYEWSKHFPKHNLIAYSTHPLLIFPTHYVGDMGYFSDTEPPGNWLQWKRNEYKKREEMEKRLKEIQEASSKPKEEL